MTGMNPLAPSEGSWSDPFVFATTSRYTADEFYGVVVDTGASKKSTAGYGQYLAYSKIHDIAIDTAKASQVNVQFGIGSAPSISSVTLDTPVSRIEFHVVQADTPFLHCHADMDSL